MAGAASGGVLCVRLTARPRALFRRLLRLRQLSGRGLSVGADDAAGGGAASAEEGGASGLASAALDPLPSADLLARFGLVKYESYPRAATFAVFANRCVETIFQTTCPRLALAFSKLN
jgi:hypothetical protein